MTFNWGATGSVRTGRSGITMASDTFMMEKDVMILWANETVEKSQVGNPYEASSYSVGPNTSFSHTNSSSYDGYAARCVLR